MCRAELRRLKTVYPDFEDRLAFYAVGVDPFESLEELEEYRASEGYPWPMAIPESSLIADLRVTAQSTKVAIDHQGVITYRDGYGRGDEELWRQVMEELVEKAGE